MMGILAINLKQLYQRRGLWLGYLMFALFVWVSLMVALDDPRAGAGTFIGLILLVFLVGMAAAVVQMEILTKPMAFCLPQHRRIVGRFILTIGVVANAVAAMLFLFYPGLPLAWRLLVLGSAFAAGLVFYLAGAWWVFLVRQPMALVGFLIAAFFFGRQLGLHVRLERIVVLHPLAGHDDRSSDGSGDMAVPDAGGPGPAQLPAAVDRLCRGARPRQTAPLASVP